MRGCESPRAPSRGRTRDAGLQQRPTEMADSGFVALGLPNHLLSHACAIHRIVDSQLATDRAIGQARSKAALDAEFQRSGEAQQFHDADPVLAALGPRAGSATGSRRGSKPPRSGCIITCLRSRSPTSSPALPGRFSTRSATSRSRGQLRLRPSLRKRGTVLGAVKAWPADAGAGTKAIATPTLTAPARDALHNLQAGTKERPHGTNKGTAPIRREQ